jgi:hypothetical protein
VFLTRLNPQLGILNGTPDEQELVRTEEKRFLGRPLQSRIYSSLQPGLDLRTAVKPSLSKARKGLTLTLKVIGKIL